MKKADPSARSGVILFGSCSLPQILGTNGLVVVVVVVVIHTLICLFLCIASYAIFISFKFFCMFNSVSGRGLCTSEGFDKMTSH